MNGFVYLLTHVFLPALAFSVLAAVVVWGIKNIWRKIGKKRSKKVTDNRRVFNWFADLGEKATSFYERYRKGLFALLVVVAFLWFLDWLTKIMSPEANLIISAILLGGMAIYIVCNVVRWIWQHRK